ncbi:MAG: toll/interleukin-1 receptor domain-containing protein [Planctomycetota bacterium]|nr:toll/interleukin-1 receptor domain-containing protein [Planctomycetaceae bacterium]MDQ3331674.1 toll/interleukin-1 receptor domain-containing protein [Planctomycetota bacterium]
MTPRPIFDVFLSHRSQDAGLAAFVADELREQGLDVFHSGVIAVATEAVVDDLRSALAESIAVVILVTPDYAKSPNLAFLTGAAMAWEKPVYILYDGLDLSELPDFLGQYRVAPITAVGEIGRQIKEEYLPFSAEQEDALREAYAELGIPADQLVMRVSARAQLVRIFAEKTQLDVGAERLLRELLNKRKRGQLPRLQAPRIAEPA